jgi:hypothetical protein
VVVNNQPTLISMLVNKGILNDHPGDGSQPLMRFELLAS